MIFVDECKLKLKAGNGGNGVVSWRHEKHVAEGGPDGGNGGNGGNVIFEGDHNLNNLYELKFNKYIFAQNGENGKGEKRNGHNGNDIIVKVPLGTSVYNANTNEIIDDILIDKYQKIVCNGGKGGWGNAFFKSAKNRIPTLHENGDIGDEIDVILKLKYIADVGVIGLPNAGKSTFVNAITNSKAKIGNYQFTTLTPNLGTYNFGDNKTIVFADIPGLIEGASAGKGLGHEFLKHIERCEILIHLVSLENENLFDTYNAINNELKLYSSALINKKIFIVINKIDIEEENIKIIEFKKHFKDQKIYEISAKNKLNLDILLKDIEQSYVEFYANKNNIVDDTNNNIKVIELVQEIDYAKELQIKQISKNTFLVDSKYLEY
jgi:GTP-binding protein